MTPTFVLLTFRGTAIKYTTKDEEIHNAYNVRLALS